MARCATTGRQCRTKPRALDRLTDDHSDGGYEHRRDRAAARDEEPDTRPSERMDDLAVDYRPSSKSAPAIASEIVK